MEVGQQALREHIDTRLDSLAQQMESRDQELPISAPIWSFRDARRGDDDLGADANRVYD